MQSMYNQLPTAKWMLIAAVLMSGLMSCSDSAELNAQIEELHEQRKRLRSELESLNSARDELQQQVAAQEIEIHHANRAISELTIETDHLRRLLENANRATDAEKQHEAEIAHAISTLRRKLQAELDLIREIMDITSDGVISPNDPTITQHWNRVNHLRRQLDYIQSFQRIPPPEYFFVDNTD